MEQRKREKFLDEIFETECYWHNKQIYLIGALLKEVEEIFYFWNDGVSDRLQNKVTDFILQFLSTFIAKICIFTM